MSFPEREVELDPRTPVFVLKPVVTVVLGVVVDDPHSQPTGVQFHRTRTGGFLSLYS